MILEHSGKPLANADVAVYGPARPASSGAVQATLTDANGMYHLRVPPGKQRIYIMGGFPDGYERPDEKYLTVADEQTIREDLVVPRRPGLAVNGIVLGPDGRPAARASVIAYPPRAYEPLIAKTNAFGRFHIDGIEGGTVLRARLGRLATTQAVTVNVGQHDVRLQLHTGAVVTLRGKVMDAAGKPIAQARVGLNTWYGTFGSGSGVPLLTDKNGRYEFRNLFVDTGYSISAQADGYGSGSFEAQLVPGKATDAPPLILQGANARIAGQVVYSDGRPAAGIRVGLNIGISSWKSMTDQRGHFEFHVVAGAHGRIVAYGGQHLLDSTEVAAGDEDVRVVVPRAAPHGAEQ